MYVLGVRLAENGASGVIVEWRYPPGMASNQSAWVGLHAAATPRWIRAQERSKYKMISKNTAAGSVTFTASETKHVRDGEYVFALWRDGALLATSQRVPNKDGAAAAVDARRGMCRAATADMPAWGLAVAEADAVACSAAEAADERRGGLLLPSAVDRGVGGRRVGEQAAAQPRVPGDR